MSKGGTYGKVEDYLIFKEFENLSVEKKMLSTALGFEPRSLNFRSTALNANDL